MKCIRCNHDSTYAQRKNRNCPKCSLPFAFEPKTGDPVTDMLFKNAIDAVSAEGRIRWGIEHLYYEICRRKRGKVVPLLAIGIVAGTALLLFGIALSTRFFPFGFFAFIAAIIALIMAATRMQGPFVRLELNKFNLLWDRWTRTHGVPKGLIVRQAPRLRAGAGKSVPATSATVPAFGKRQGEPAARRPLERDIGDYSFDRAVICDRARTVDLLVANNFHFENNCAILSYDGYPDGQFQTIKTMLKRNPRLRVFALHDATPDGCAMAQRLATEKDWFDGRIRIIDLGLRPNHAGPFHGLLLPAKGQAVQPGPGINQNEADWLRRHQLEIAAVRPEQVIKRLFAGLTAHAGDDTSGGGVTNCGSFDGGGGGADGGGDGHGADAFG